MIDVVNEKIWIVIVVNVVIGSFLIVVGVF